MPLQEPSFWDKVWQIVSGFPGGIIAGIAAMSSVQWALQIAFGQPKLSVSLQEGGDNSNGDLHCSVCNQQIYNRPLRRLGVKRESPTLFGSFDVCKSELREIIVDQATIYFYVDGDDDEKILSKRATLDSFLPVRFDIAHRLDNQTWLEAGKTKGSLISNNQYELTARLCYGNEMFMFKAQFICAQNLYWVPDSYERIKLK